MKPTRQRLARVYPTTCLALAASMACLPGTTAAQSRTETLVISGQIAAGAGAGSFSSFSAPVLNDAGQTAFSALITGGTSTAGVYRNSAGGKPQAVALQGQSAAGAGAGQFSGDFQSLAMNDGGQTAFVASIAGGTSTQGLYRSSSGATLTPLALRGQSATGTGGGTFSAFLSAPVLNDAGQTAFVASIAGGIGTEGIFRSSSGGTLTALALQGRAATDAGAGTFSRFFNPVLNGTGQIAFQANITGGTSTQGVYRSSSGSPLTALALQGQSAPGAGAGKLSAFDAPALNDAGQTAFVASITGGTSTVGLYRSNSDNTLSAVALQGQNATGTGGGTFSGLGNPTLNNAGQTAFLASIAGGTGTEGIFRSNSGSALTAIALHGQSAAGAGAGTFASFSNPELNEGGQIAFVASITGGTSTDGLYVSDGIDTFAVVMQGASLAGKVVSLPSKSERSLNRHGQVAYRASFTDGAEGNFLFTPALRWRSSSSGNWGQAANWTLSLNPAEVHDVTLDPSNSLTVTGPTGTAAVRSLQVGTGPGIATLAMAGGRIDAQTVVVGKQGVLSGTGSFGSRVSNQGVVQAERLQFLGGLDNAGTVRGATGLGSRLETNLNNTSSGRVRVGSGETLQLVGKAHQNEGVVEVNAGRLETSGSFTNAKLGIVDMKNATVVADGDWRNDPSARLLLNEARVTTSGGFSNAGQVLVTSGSSEFFGTMANQKGGQVILSGNGGTTFYDAVELQAGSELRTSAGATAVFFGAVAQRSGALLTGTGHKYFEGGLGVGNSPGLGEDAGNVSFGVGNVYLAEIGGTTLGSGHDHYRVAGTLTLGGTLQLVSFAGFTGQAGQRFDLFDWGTLQGQFGSIDSSGLQLAAGTRLDVSRLYVDGVVSVTAVPEPANWALLLAGLFGVGLRARSAHRHTGPQAA